MNTIQTRLATVGVALIAVATVAFSSGEAATKGPTLDNIKALVGTWVPVDKDGKPTDEVASTYRISAGGSAILATEFPGSDHEMLTVYTMNHGSLELDHYCVMGNQPHMIARADSPTGEIIFECDGHGGNMNCEVDQHMHKGHLTFPSKDRIVSTWSMVTEGKVTYEAKFDLVRKKEDKR